MRPLKQLNRRSFLTRSGTLALSLTVLPRQVIGAPGQPGPNDQVIVGAIGVGRQGSGLLEWLARVPGARVGAVADVDYGRALGWGAKLKAPAFQDYRELLDRKDVDAIITATPEQWRGLICIHACQAGKDIYAEKPMSLTISEGRRIVEAVRKHRRVFQTGSQQRSMAANRKGCELIRNGRLGRITRVIAHNYPSPWICRLPAEPVPPGLDWDRWIGPAPFVPFHSEMFIPRGNPGWLSCRHYSGGEMTGWGSHGFDQVQWALDMDHGGPVEIWTDGESRRTTVYDKPETRDRGDAWMRQPRVYFRYGNGVVMELGDGPPGGAIFIGANGRMTIDRGICRSEPEELAEEPLGADATRLPVSNNHIQNWLQCIRTREMPMADAEIGHRSASVCHLGNIARRLGRRLQWDPVKENFGEDWAANELLDRKRRPGYELPRV